MINITEQGEKAAKDAKTLGLTARNAGEEKEEWKFGQEVVYTPIEKSGVKGFIVNYQQVQKAKQRVATPKKVKLISSGGEVEHFGRKRKKGRKEEKEEEEEEEEKKEKEEEEEEKEEKED